MDVAELETPALLVDLDLLERNLAEMQAFADRHRVSLRPHAKSHKTLEIARRQIELGAVGLTVATLREAEVFAEAGITDLFIAFPIVGEAKLRRLGQLLRMARVTLLLDHADVARGYADLAKRMDLELPVLVEIDTGLGRGGCAPGPGAVELCQVVAREHGLRFRGLMTHEGHVQRAGAPEQVVAAGLEAGRAMVATADGVRKAGLDVAVVSVGSTTSATTTPTVPGITEMRPGIYAFYDATRIAQGVVSVSRAAAMVLATIVGRPAPERVVLDAGSKALGSDALGVASARSGFGMVLDRPDWLIERLWEEHAVARVPSSAAAEIGERVRIVPNHICSAVNLFDEMIVVREGTVAARWEIAARGRSP